MQEILQVDDMTDEEYELYVRGFVFNTDGHIIKHNPNYFAKHVKDNYDLIFAKDKTWYQYQNKSVFVEITEDELEQFVYEEMQEPRFGVWDDVYERKSLKAMKNLLFTSEILNNNRDLINLKNGMYDTVNNELIAHDPKYLSTIQVPIEFDETATCPIFEGLLDEWFEGDEERITKAIEWLGYSISTNTSAQKALFLWGLGSNGKGVFTEILTHLVHKDNVSNVALNELQKNFYRATLYGKSLNIASETEFGNKKFNTQYFKAITGQDRINADFKNKQVFSFDPTVKLVISMNNFPMTNDNTNGYYRRIDFLPFTCQFSEEEQDRSLKDKVILTEMPGIFNLAMKGLNQLRANEFEFSPCAESDKVLKAYKAELNPMILFFDECIEKADEEHQEDRKTIVEAYHNWVDENCFGAENKFKTPTFWNRFRAEAEKRNIKTKNGHSGSFNYQTGVKLKGQTTSTRMRPKKNKKNPRPQIDLSLFGEDEE